MPKHQTEASRFRSRFEGGFVSESQFLAEGICDRQARSKGKTLPPKFWNMPQYKRTFLLQLRHANSLLKLYDIQSIINALKTNQGKRIYSLGAKWLDPLIQEQQRVLETQQKLREQGESATPIPISDVHEKPRQQQNAQKSILGKLRDLDG